MIKDMDLNYNWVSLLDTVGFIQGATLGILLIVLNKRKHRSTFFLGLFLVLFSFERVPMILQNLNVFDYYPELFRLPFNFFWLLFPIIFVYTQQVSIFSNQKTRLWVLYPGIASFFLQLFFFFLPYQTKLIASQSIWFHLFFIIGLSYGWVIALWNLKLIRQNRIEVQNYFSLIEYKELQWTRAFLIFLIIGSFLYVFQFYMLPKNIYSQIFYLFFDLTIIYWVSFHGVVQRNILSVLNKQKSLGESLNKSSGENKEAPATNEKTEVLMQRIDDFMTTSESFLHKELTVVDLAKALGVHERRISTAINTVHQENFNSYVNRFRIKKAKKLLNDQGTEYLSVEGIGNEVGFHSKSAFYSSFKKVTGTTPSKYKENVVY